MSEIRSLNSIESAKLGTKAPEEKSLEAARQFEGLLMCQLFQAMRKTVVSSGLFGNEKNSRETYEYLLDKALVEQAMGAGRGWGVAERIHKAWSEKESPVSK